MQQASFTSEPTPPNVVQAKRELQGLREAQKHSHDEHRAMRIGELQFDLDRLEAQAQKRARGPGHYTY